MNSNSTRNPSGKAAFLGVMTAAALMLSYIESLFILVPGIPGIKPVSYTHLRAHET